jgi:hypothetical protein
MVFYWVIKETEPHYSIEAPVIEGKFVAGSNEIVCRWS